MIKKNYTFGLIVFGTLWCFSLLLLIVALTNIIGKNAFQPYRLIIGIGFLAVSFFLRSRVGALRHK